ncbi:hypothetical protein LINGRAHAP2_LOCUS28352 [Linum grandiflorum]
MELELQSEPPCISHDSFFADDFDSTCSTPFVSAPSSPGRSSNNNPSSGGGGGFFYSCPASPMHFAITSSAAHRSSYYSDDEEQGESDFEPGSRSLNEFEFSARFGSAGAGHTGSMSSADELFLNGQIRPMKLSSHLEKPQVLAPLLDLEEEEEDEAGEGSGGNKLVEKGYNGESRGRDLRLRNKSLRRRTRSMSPLRSSPLDDEVETEETEGTEKKVETEEEAVAVEVDPIDCSSSTSRSSSAGRNSKRWVFLKEFLYRSKSEGRSTSSNSNKFWSNISFSPAKEKKAVKGQGSNEASSGTGTGTKKPVNGIGRKRVPAPSPHELHYKASRAQAEEMRKKTFLPYRQGLLGCLGFSSKGYGAMNGFARALNPVSSR